MYTSVKIRVEAKRRLEELQARLKLRGIRARLSDILEKLIELGLEEEDLLVSKFRGVEGEDPMLKLLDRPVDWGVRDASLRIDEALYGGGLGSVHRHVRVRGGEEQERR